MESIIDIVKGVINPESIGGIRVGDGDCGTITNDIPVVDNEKSPE